MHLRRTPPRITPKLRTGKSEDIKAKQRQFSVAGTIFSRLLFCPVMEIMPIAFYDKPPPPWLPDYRLTNTNMDGAVAVSTEDEVDTIGAYPPRHIAHSFRLGRGRPSTDEGSGMIDLFNAIFYSFWTFIGTLMLLGVITQGTVALAAILFGRKP